MVKFLKSILFVLVFAGLSSAQQAQPGTTPVQQVQPLYNCNVTQTATGAANTAVTASVTPPNGQSFYLCSLYIVEVNNAAVTPAAGPAPIFTTTGLAVNMVWWGDNGTAGIGIMKVITDEVWTLAVKGQASQTFSVVTSAGQATESVRINFTGFYGTP